MQFEIQFIWLFLVSLTNCARRTTKTKKKRTIRTKQPFNWKTRNCRLLCFLFTYFIRAKRAHILLSTEKKNGEKKLTRSYFFFVIVCGSSILCCNGKKSIAYTVVIICWFFNIFFFVVDCSKPYCSYERFCFLFILYQRDAVRTCKKLNFHCLKKKYLAGNLSLIDQQKQIYLNRKT